MSSEYERNYARFLPSDKNAKILDLGCGSGELLYWLRSKGYVWLTGVDKRYDSRLDKDFVFRRQDLMAFLNNKGVKYDLIILRFVIEHLPKKGLPKLVMLLRERLSESGVIVVETPNGEFVLAASQRYADLQHEVMFTKETLRKLLEPRFNVKIYKSVLPDDTLQSKLRNAILMPAAGAALTALFRCLGVRGAWLESVGIIAVCEKKVMR